MKTRLSAVRDALVVPLHLATAAAAIVLATGVPTLADSCPPESTAVQASSAGMARISPRRPVATYSIVARDPETGMIGVAVQSHWFSVGAVVPWAEAGVGAIATQSLVDPSYGALGLEMMRMGKSADDTLRALAAGDSGREIRQVAMIDANGRVAARTGDKCIAMAGQVVDPEFQFSVQANMMEKSTVWEAMASAYRKSKGDLADRMMAAMEAAQSQGGDIRGKQSAAMVIVRAEPSGKPWLDRVFDLRVEDNPEPLKELRRLIQVQRAYHHMNEGDLAVEEGDFERAAAEYDAAREFAPQIVEVTFWYAATLVSAGKIDESLPLFAEVFRKEPIWKELVPRLVEVGIMPNDPDAIQRILAQE